MIILHSLFSLLASLTSLCRSALWFAISFLLLQGMSLQSLGRMGLGINYLFFFAWDYLYSSLSVQGYFHWICSVLAFLTVLLSCSSCKKSTIILAFVPEHVMCLFLWLTWKFCLSFVLRILNWINLMNSFFNLHSSVFL